MASLQRYWMVGGLFLIFCVSNAFAQKPQPQPQPHAMSLPVEMVIRLIYGTNNSSQKEDAELSKLVDTLKRDFGYLNYEVKSSEKFTLNHDETAVKDMGQGFIFIARNLGMHRDRKKVWLELWFRQKKIFGAFSLFCNPSKPLLIKGPNTNEGTYIIVVSMSSCT